MNFVVEITRKMIFAETRQKVRGILTKFHNFEYGVVRRTANLVILERSHAEK